MGAVRIVYMLNSLGIGGAERQTLALAEHMVRRGHVVSVLVLRPRLGEEWPTSLKVVHLDIRKSPASVLTGMAEARRFLRDFRPGLVHSQSFHSNIAARLLKLLVPAPLVLSTVHNVYEGPWPRMLVYRLTDGLSRRTTVVSEAVARRFVRLGAIPGHKCMVVLNGIDAAEFEPDPVRRMETRAAMKANGCFIWLAAGRFAPGKDYPNLLAAFAKVRASRPDARLWIVGEAGGGAISSLQALAARVNAADAIRWLGLRRDMPALLDAADAFVQASMWEGMPLTVGEAMAMEKPVAATDAGGVRELVGDAGLVVPRRNPAALAEVMLDLMGWEPASREALGRAARERVLSQFSMEARAGEWEALYQGLAAGKD
jgi:glycosyltransferase involved in cell wall biosynthesis